MNQYLFNNGSLSEYLNSLCEGTRREVSKLSKSDLADGRLDYLVGALAKKLSLKAPLIDKDRMAVKQFEADMVVPSRMHGKTKMRGHKYEVYVPFSGDGQLFYFRPSSYNHNPPPATVQGSELVLTVEQPIGVAIEAVKTKYMDVIQSIEWYLDSVKKDLEVHNSKVAVFINEAMNKRRTELVHAEEMLNSLGLKKRE